MVFCATGFQTTSRHISLKLLRGTLASHNVGFFPYHMRHLVLNAAHPQPVTEYPTL